MGVPSTLAKLSTVRSDLDLPAVGSILDRPVLNKVNRQSPPVSLADFKGNVLGTQLQIVKSYSSWQKSRNVSTSHYYISPQGGDSEVVGNRLAVTCTSDGRFDIGMECRILGKVQEEGTHRYSGMSFGRFGSDSNYMHLYLIENKDDWLVGDQKIVWAYEYNQYAAGGEKSWSDDVNLTLSRPYITAIFRNVYKRAGGGNVSTMDFWDWKLQKI